VVVVVIVNNGVAVAAVVLAIVVVAAAAVVISILYCVFLAFFSVISYHSLSLIATISLYLLDGNKSVGQRH
jgi:hypothetical protein